MKAFNVVYQGRVKTSKSTYLWIMQTLKSTFTALQFISRLIYIKAFKKLLKKVRAHAKFCYY